ncbi:hypothetical protein BST61_g596 [Cercospora zeina]
MPETGHEDDANDAGWIDFDAYQLIISRLLAEGHDYDTRVLTVHAAIKARFPHKTTCAAFKARVDGVVTKSPKPSRNVAFVASLWLPEVVRLYNANLFCAEAAVGKVFTQPAVINELFTDTSMHNLENHASLLWDGHGNAQIDIRA